MNYCLHNLLVILFLTILLGPCLEVVMDDDKSITFLDLKDFFERFFVLIIKDVCKKSDTDLICTKDFK